MGNIREILTPDIGDFESVEVIDILVQPGDAIKPEDSLITLESDKATLDIPSPSTGIVKQIKVKLGDRISEGTPIMEIEETDAAEDLTQDVFLEAWRWSRRNKNRPGKRNNRLNPPPPNRYGRYLLYIAPPP